MTTRRLARKINRPPAATRAAPTGPWVVGTVTAVNLATNSLTATIHGDTTAIPGIGFMDSYMPVVGDNVNLVRIKNHYWVVGSVAGAYVPLGGPGANTNIIPGGANRANTQPFRYSTSQVVTTTAGGGWSYTDSTSGYTWLGCGSFHVTPGDVAGGLVFLAVQLSNCSISSADLQISGGSAYNFSGGVVNAMGSGTNIRVNISAVGW